MYDPNRLPRMKRERFQRRHLSLMNLLTQARMMAGDDPATGAAYDKDNISRWELRFRGVIAEARERGTVIQWPRDSQKDDLYGVIAIEEFLTLARELSPVPFYADWLSGLSAIWQHDYERANGPVPGSIDTAEQASPKKAAPGRKRRVLADAHLNHMEELAAAHPGLEKQTLARRAIAALGKPSGCFAADDGLDYITKLYSKRMAGRSISPR